MNDIYIIGEKLGQGSFGSVYRGFNKLNGKTVAIKRISLENKDEVMSEINLLKKLNHPQIVRYIFHELSQEHVYIVMEFCENGSLQAMNKKFGRFPEALVAQYVYQILEGLNYLHQQGIIHRDIKGSNILSTKEGCIKLADFGVAVKAGSLHDYSVVGSPYWMAPEVVNQSDKTTTASDIWSLGALIIELLTGRPPYFFLDPMPALFRIVNDDMPPLPEDISSEAKSFLVACFQKDPALRSGAKSLLNHAWVRKGKSTQAVIEIRNSITEDKHSTQATRQNYNEESLSPISVRKVPIVVAHRDETFGDVWDDDFQLEGLNTAVFIQPVGGIPRFTEKHSTLRVSTPNPPILTRKTHVFVEDYSNLLEQEDADPFEDKVAALKKYNLSKNRLLHPKDIFQSPA